MMTYCEDWVEPKLRKRLESYKRRYPAFKIDRVMETVEKWPAKMQRWAPYMEDKDIASINRSNRKSRSIESLAENEHL